MREDALTAGEMMALALLEQIPDQVGTIESEEQLAAALIYAGLTDRGLAIGSLQPSGGPIYRITPAGLDALLKARGVE